MKAMPCICGGQPIRRCAIYYGEAGKDYVQWSVDCTSLSCTLMTDKQCDTEEQAIEEWNRRQRMYRKKQEK